MVRVRRLDLHREDACRSNLVSDGRMVRPAEVREARKERQSCGMRKKAQARDATLDKQYNLKHIAA